MLPTLIVIALVGGTLIADYFLKVASVERNPLMNKCFVIGTAIYAMTAVATVCGMKHLKLVTIGVVYSVSMILLLTLMGTVIFGETLERREIAGIILAIASIFLLAKFL